MKFITVSTKVWISLGEERLDWSSLCITNHLRSTSCETKLLPSSSHPLIKTVAIRSPNYTNPSNLALCMVNTQTCLFANQIQWFTNTLLKAFQGSTVRILLYQGRSSKTTFSAVAGLVSSISSRSLYFCLSHVVCEQISPRSALLKTEIILRDVSF